MTVFAPGHEHDVAAQLDRAQWLGVLDAHMDQLAAAGAVRFLELGAEAYSFRFG